MSKLKRSRALRRNLRKQARKGTLSARERKTLLQQEKRFRKARRPFMRGLGFGAGLGAGALLVPGVGGLISGLGGIRPGKKAPEDMEEFGGDMIQAGEIKTGAPAIEDRGLIGDIQVVGEAPDEAMRAVGEEVEGEGEEAPAAQVTAPRVDEFGATVPADMDDDEVLERLADDRTLYPQIPTPEGSSDGTWEYHQNPTDGALERIEALEQAENASPDYTGGFGEEPLVPFVDYLPPNDRMSSMAPRLPQQIDRGASEMGGTPRSQARSQVQQAANEAARLRMEDAAARGQEYNKALNQVLDNAALVGENPLLGDPGILRALRGFGRRGGRRSSSFAEGGRIDKSNDLVARIKRKYGLR